MVQEQSDIISRSESNVAKVKSRRLYSFEEARRIARGHGFDSKEEFLEYTCPGAYQIPKDADVVWAESWNGWEDFLGITLTFTEGREVARKLEGIESEEAYMTLMKSCCCCCLSCASDEWFFPNQWTIESSGSATLAIPP
jgi:hypothetical protein